MDTEETESPAPLVSAEDLKALRRINAALNAHVLREERQASQFNRRLRNLETTLSEAIDEVSFADTILATLEHTTKFGNPDADTLFADVLRHLRTVRFQFASAHEQLQILGEENRAGLV